MNYMKKLFTLLVMLIIGIGSTWATTITLNGSTGTGGVVASGFGFTLPDEAKDGTVYSLSSFTVGLRGTYTYAYYMAICTEKKATGAAVSYPESKVIAVSNNVPTANTSGRFTYNFSKPVKLVKGVTYYVQFLTANTPTDGNYQTIQQGVYVETGSDGAYPPSIYSGNGTYTKFIPNFTTTLTEISSSESEYWSSLNSNSIDHAAVQRIKVVTPSTNSYYRLSAFSLYLCNTSIASSEHNNYMLISKKSDASGTISTDDIVGISKNHPSASGNNVEERFFFDDICLDGNTAYYLYFTASNTPTDGVYTLCKEKIKQSSTTTNPSVWWNNTLQNWEPRYYSTLDVLKKVTFSQPVAVNGGDAVSAIYLATDGSDHCTLPANYKYTIGGVEKNGLQAETAIAADDNSDISVTVSSPVLVNDQKYRILQAWTSNRYYLYSNTSDGTNGNRLWKNAASATTLLTNANYIWQAKSSDSNWKLYNPASGRYISKPESTSADGTAVNGLSATSSDDAEPMSLVSAESCSYPPSDYSSRSYFALKATTLTTYLNSYSTGNNYVGWHNAVHAGYYFRFIPVKTVTFVDGDSNPIAIAVNGGAAVSKIYVATDGTDVLELSNQYKYKINGGDPLSYSTASTEISSAGTADITVTVVGPTDEQTTAYNTVLGWKSKVFVSEGLVKDAANYSGNAISDDGTGLPALLDNNTSTYCHTSYNGRGTDPGADHYIQAFIEDGVSDFYLYTYKRNVNNRPTQIDITASNDGSEWTTITSLTSGLTDKDDFLSDKISLGDTYKYIRFTVPTTNTGNKFGDHVFFTYSEFWLLPSNTHTDAAFSTLKSLVSAVELSSEKIEEINDIDLEIRTAIIAPWKEAFIASAGESSNFGKVGWPSATAYSTFCDAINALTVDDDYESDAETAMTTLWSTVTYPATGYYYLHNKGTGRYAFSDETVSTNQDYLNDESRTSKYIWKVTLDGANVKVYSLTGHGITLNNQGGEQTGNLALETPDANSYKDARGALFMGCIQDPNQNSFTKNGGTYVSATNPMKLTHYDGDRNNNKAYWIFEPVDASAYDVYTVSFVNAPGNNYVSYSGSETTGNKKVYDGGCYFMTKDATISASDFTGESVTNYSSVVSIEANNITITYTVSNWEAFINDYIETNDVWTKLANAGKPGYPENTPQNTLDLTMCKTIITGGTYNKTIYNTLQTAYDTYKSKEVITTVPAGKFYRFKAAKSGKFLKGEDSGTASTEANGYHLLNTVGEEGAKSIFYFKANAESNPSLLGYSSGRYVRYTSHLAPVGADGVSTFEFELPNTYFGALSVKANATSGNWGRYLYSHTGSQDYANQQESKAAETDWYLEEVTSLPVTFNSAALGYATFNSPVPLQVPSNTTAYICKVGEKEVDDKTVNTLTFYQITNITTKGNAGNDVPTIPANTPVLLYNSAVASSNVTVNFPITSLEYDMDPTYIEGSFGTLAAESFDDVKDVWTDSEDNEWDIYSLRVNSTQSKVGFYKKTRGTTLAGFKAWLKTQPTDGARNFVISFDGEGDPTGIVEALGLQNDNVEIYDLNGRKLSSYKKGINIVNGKKVMIQ